MKNKKKTIILSGGGTGGSVVPLLAVAKYLQDDYNFKWIVSRRGAETEILLKEKISFVAIASGKWRRYFSFRNLIDPIFILVGFFQSIFWLIYYRPQLTISAGSFVSVPVVWAAKLLGIPSIIHQQDMRPGLANKLMLPAAKVITTVFEKSVSDYGAKARWIGNPSFFPEIKKDDWPWKKDLPILMVMGGGTGAQGINDLIVASLEELIKFCQIVHITGRQKGNSFSHPNYYPFEFVDHRTVLSFLTKADLVISRAGLGALTELTALAKASILIPMPNSHQEDNAEQFRGVALLMSEKDIEPQLLVAEIKNILFNKDRRDRMAQGMKGIIRTGAEFSLAEIIKEIIN